MKKVISLCLILILCAALTVPALAAQEELVITMQPCSPNYPEYSVAIYTVKASGSNLRAFWYISYEGQTYNASQIGGSMQPWEAYAGESYGAKQLDANTFCFVFEGIEKELNGARIWCVIEDGHHDVVSREAYITVGNYATPPEIVDVPAQITVQKGSQAEIRCIARSNGNGQLGFLWYETSTGNLPEIQAVNRGTEDNDTLFCDTSSVGTRYYICGISTTEGGQAYTGAVEVKVVEKTATAEIPKIQTQTLPDAMVGTQYSIRLQCTDPEAEFFAYYNPGTPNDLEEGSWLGLSADGWLMGTPTQAGTYQFTVCAMGTGGEDYASYTLNVVEADTPDATEPATEPDTTATEPTAPASNDTCTPSAENKTQEEPHKEGIAWWVLVLVGLGAAAIGVGAAILLNKKK